MMAGEQWNPTRVNFSGANQAMANASRSMNSAGDVARGILRRADEEEYRNKMAQERADVRQADMSYKAGRDTILDTRANEAAKALAQQNEYDMLLKSAKMGTDADYQQATLGLTEKQIQAAADESKRTAEHRASMMDLSNKQFNKGVADTAYTNQMGEGTILGQAYQPEETQLVSDPNAMKIDSNLLGKEITGLQNMVGDGSAPLGDKQRLAEYIKYKEANDPNFNQTTGEKILQAGKNQMMRIPATVAGAVVPAYKNITMSEKDKLLDRRNSSGAPISNKILSESEFYKKLDEKSAGEKEAKDAISQWALGQNKAADPMENINYLKGKGIISQDTDATTNKILSKTELQSNANDVVSQYKKEHPKASKATILGIQKGVNENVNKILVNQRENAKLQLKQLQDNFSQGQKQMYAKELAQFKAELDSNREPTMLEQAQIAERIAKTEALNQKIKDATPWYQ